VYDVPVGVFVRGMGAEEFVSNCGKVLSGLKTTVGVEWLIEPRVHRYYNNDNDNIEYYAEFLVPEQLIMRDVPNAEWKPSEEVLIEEPC
ncbi:MAG: hypothetical protein ACWGQW_24070, partial [bacterium]